MWRRWGTPQNFLLAFTDELCKSWKIWFLKKWKKLMEISSFYICVPKTTIIWGTIFEIWNETEFFVILGNFLLFYPPITTQKTKILQNKKHKTCKTKNTITWCMLTQIWSATDKILHHFRPFLYFYPILTPKIELWKKCKKQLDILSF